MRSPEELRGSQGDGCFTEEAQGVGRKPWVSREGWPQGGHTFDITGFLYLSYPRRAQFTLRWDCGDLKASLMDTRVARLPRQ